MKTEQHYRNAFEMFLDGDNRKFEIKKEEYRTSYLAKLDDRLYRIAKFKDIEEDYAEILTTEDSAHEIPVEIWVEIIHDVHKKSDFHFYLTNGIDSDDLQRINLAISLSTISDDPRASFWNALDGQLYGRAIFAAAKTMNIKILAEEIVGHLVENGLDYLNAFQDGVFEEIDLNDDEDPEADIFYIYTVEDLWD